MPSIVVERTERIATVRIDRPPVNALDVDTLNGLSDALDAATNDETRAVVLTGTGTTMSAGADLVKVLGDDDAYVDAGIDGLSRCFRTLFEFPKPVVAAVNGHALAGGAVLTCGCDYRVMGRSAGRIGVIELAAGVPFPAWALELVRHAVNNEHFQELVYFGAAYEPTEAVAKGLIDELCPDELLMSRAVERAEQLARVPATTFALTKRSMRAAAVASANSLMRFDDDIKAAWRSSEVQDAVRRQMEALRRS